MKTAIRSLAFRSVTAGMLLAAGLVSAGGASAQEATSLYDYVGADESPLFDKSVGRRRRLQGGGGER